MEETLEKKKKTGRKKEKEKGDKKNVKGQNKRKKEAQGKKYMMEGCKGQRTKRMPYNEGNTGPVWPPTGLVGEGARHRRSAPTLKVRTEVQYTQYSPCRNLAPPGA